jgi:hypothetical protein
MAGNRLEKLRAYYKLSYDFRLCLNAALVSLEWLIHHDRSNNNNNDNNDALECLHCIRDTLQQMNELFQEAVNLSTDEWNDSLSERGTPSFPPKPPPAE